MPTKILAIDDSKTMRLAIKITFAAEDYDVVAVSKGSEAVARAKQMPADVLIVDAALAAGEPSGYDVVKAIRADPDTAAEAARGPGDQGRSVVHLLHLSSPGCQLWRARWARGRGTSRRG